MLITAALIWVEDPKDGEEERAVESLSKRTEDMHYFSERMISRRKISNCIHYFRNRRLIIDRGIILPLPVRVDV